MHTTLEEKHPGVSPDASPSVREVWMSTSAEVGELERAECLRLLVEQCVGRVVFTDGALPGARPVNYMLDGEEVVFRTGTDGRLAKVTRDKVVGFEVDSIDAWARTGWSVLGVGQ